MGCQTQTASVRQSGGGGPETFIIYDELSSPGADDYITPLEAGLKPTFKKIQPQAHW